MQNSLDNGLTKKEKESVSTLIIAILSKELKNGKATVNNVELILDETIDYFKRLEISLGTSGRVGSCFSISVSLFGKGISLDSFIV